MLIWPSFLMAQESQGRTTPLRGHHPDLARSAQTVNCDKDLVPRELGAATPQVFKVARTCAKDHVDHLLYGQLRLCQRHKCFCAAQSGNS
jgi:hypothetical protein